MNENICLANFSSKMKVTGKVDLQYVMEDGSVIHNESKNMAFPSTWAASGLIKSLLNGSLIQLELTDCDDEPDLKFPFLKGNPVGYAYLNSTSSGNYRGAEIANKRVSSFENGKLVVSFTYEWTASQIPGTIRSIGYTLQNRSDMNTDAYYNWLTVPIITGADQPCFRYVMDGEDKTVYDYFRKVTYRLYDTSASHDSTGCYISTTIYKKLNKEGASKQSKRFKMQVYPSSVYSFARLNQLLYYDVDTGEIGTVWDYYVKETSTSDYQKRRCLCVIDFEGGTYDVKWDVLLKVDSSSYTQPYFSPFGKDVPPYQVVVKKNGKLYLKLGPTNGDTTSVINKIKSEPSFTTTFCYTSPENLKKLSELSDFTFCKRFAKTISDKGIYDVNYCCGSSYSSSYVWGWVINQNNDIGYIASSEYVLDGSLSSYSALPVNVLIDSENDQLIISRMLMCTNNSDYLNDGLIESYSFGGEKIYYVPKYYLPSGSSYPMNFRGCADAQMFQALTHFHVPAEVQVRPENSGVRIVYELTISNQT